VVIVGGSDWVLLAEPMGPAQLAKAISNGAIIAKFRDRNERIGITPKLGSI